MPRFFFDIDDGQTCFRDDEGSDLADLRAARDEAVCVLPDIARDRLPDGTRRDFAVTVRDEAGRVVFRATLRLTTEAMDADGPG